MPSENRDWSVPAPVRTLLWWPAIAFVLVIVAPDASVGLIIGAGLALAVLGVLLSAARRGLGEATAAPAGSEAGVEFAVTEEQAA